jgi:hypothetical protein
MPTFELAVSPCAFNTPATRGAFIEFAHVRVTPPLISAGSLGTVSAINSNAVAK